MHCHNRDMIYRLFLLFTIVPAIELVVLLQVHHYVSEAWGMGTGLLVTIGTIFLTGIVGAWLARQQGASVLRQLQTQLRNQQMPGQALADGVLVLIGAALLLTPGFLTDICGFSLLIPTTRATYRRMVMKWFEQYLRRRRAGGADVFVVDAVPSDKSPTDQKSEKRL
ncbi:phage T7 F exclusion suppressor FxsA [Thalassoglobus neptunius]|uniref:Phage T7 F exclusion suppressor FxsA n=2 Tax=Thalassoglobus neptunius TaxID=1938619 RepID=A0A5C5WBN9_9PLAN|nr:phage T7 F exclusion suppressor FxsA [Thalassoglobus neptunius]